MLRKSIAVAALAAAVAGCGPSADPDDYFFEVTEYRGSFAAAEIECRGQVARSHTWFSKARQAIFDQCMQTQYFFTPPVWMR